MKNNNVKIRATKDNSALIINNVLVDVNLLKYHLGIPYTKKDGTHVSAEQIATLKKLASEKYQQAIRENKTNQAS